MENMCNKMTKLLNILWICGLFFGITFGQYYPQQNSATPKTSFSCQGRGAGYYADVEAGCQVYHMCDTLGRQFSYACPNTTLFQQRMLICDHWYMVNCSQAENSYKANLLIGQRDKPFVGEEEHELRTPRPDLLDQPFPIKYNAQQASRTFKSNTPAPQNLLVNNKVPKALVKQVPKTPEIFQESASNHGQPNSWNTRYAKENVLPVTADEEIQTNNLKNNDRRDIKLDEEKYESRDVVSFAPSAKETGTQNNAESFRTPSRHYEPPLLPSESKRNETRVLGSGYKAFESILNFGKQGTRQDYDFSNFFNKNKNVSNTLPTTTSTVATSTTARPQPVTQSTTKYFTTTTRRVVTTTLAPPTSVNTIPTTRFTQKSIVTFAPPTQQQQTTTTTSRPIITTQRTQKILNSQPFSQEILPLEPLPLQQQQSSYQNDNKIIFNTKFKVSDLFRSPSVILLPPFGPIKENDDIFIPMIKKIVPPVEPTQIVTERSPVTYSDVSQVPIPSKELEPPLDNPSVFDNVKKQFLTDKVYTRQPTISDPSAGPVNFAIANLGGDTSNGAKISHQHAILTDARIDDKGPKPFSVPLPSNELLPPVKEYKEYDDSTTLGPPIYYEWKWSIPSFGLLPPAPPSDGEESDNLTDDFFSLLPPLPSSNDAHNQTVRSISDETGNLGDNKVEAQTRRPLPLHNYLDLRRKFSIPEIEFPLDSEFDSNYDTTADSRNSFQIKIPQRVTQEPWYGENAQCPECHPSFLRPGTCEPCVKIRK